MYVHSAASNNILFGRSSRRVTQRRRRGAVEDVQDASNNILFGGCLPNNKIIRIILLFRPIGVAIKTRLVRLQFVIISAYVIFK